MLIIADSTENKYSTIITFSREDFNKNQIQVVLRNWFLGYLFPERDIARCNFVFSILWNCLVHLIDTCNTEPVCVAPLDNQVRIHCLKNFLHTPNFFNCPILVNVDLKEAFSWILFTCKQK